ncbi:hypothetical protein NQ315_008134 [Exocentrus adspersus]|uniref:D-2-hydroxyglutarate dehydrogenase, mitochondrial n=1 Tax=Exocentrus adspersus TaxID=1586481 RepID=A0AAV8VVN9_9CUCU|nr:hypothetical protein NQ315_008134 [Exocentrus adspersus]
MLHNVSGRGFTKLVAFSKAPDVHNLLSRKYLHAKPNFTKNTYNVSRGNYNYLHETHIKFFENLLGDQRVIMDLCDLEKYNVDWYNQVRGCSSIALKPKLTEEVSEILSYCDKNRLAVCPQGGNTSVVGGSVPVFDEVIISTELMNSIISLDEMSGILVCQAGCVLENLDNYLADKGLCVPIDLGSKGTCHIGGNVSTNAGGMRLFRHGNLHGNVLGLEVVKANGEILDCLSTLRKDNTGYHLKHLFIGSEGSLGFITKVALQCPPRPKSRNVALLGIETFDKVLTTFKKAKEQLGEIISAIDVMDEVTMEFINEMNNQKSPIGNYAYNLLIETTGSNDSHDSAKVDEFVRDVMESNLVLNGTVASEPSKIEAIWSIRENISDGYKRCNYVLYYDISLPLKDYYALVEDLRKRIGGKCKRIFGYGHLGDSNLHLQIEMNEYRPDLKDFIEPYIFKRVSEFNGSISAEHGLGFIKGKYLNLAKPAGCVALMRSLKKLLDPNGILNPYKETYNVQRKGFNELRQEHIHFFEELLGKHRAITDTPNLEKYNEDWINNLRGSTPMVLKPKTTQEVSRILSFCNENNLAVCPQAGNTGLVGGQLPVFDEIVISTELMNDVISLDVASGVVICQAGCILENIDKILAENGLMVPLDLGAKGSCHIGGNVSTNAGGLRLLRYGNLHGNVLGLEVVNANGEIIDCLSALKKDNTGYHLKHLFIGSEGTLGFITKVALQCPPRPKHTNVAFLGLQNFEKVLKTFKKVKEDLGEILSAVEVMDYKTMEFVNEKLSVKSPIGEYPFYLLIETSGSNSSHDGEKLEAFFEAALQKHLILNGTVASEPNKVNAIWSIREKIPDGFKFCGALFCYDLSLPLEHYFTIVDDTTKHLGKLPQKVFGFGHLGDGNLHLQIELHEFSKDVKENIEHFLFNRVKQLKGSFSAEHGIGFLKAQHLELARSENAVKLMKELKKLLDPKGILNPYKVLPRQ